jgi:hypothetical protein
MSANDDETFLPKMSGDRLDFSKLMDEMLDYIHENKIDEDGQPFEVEFIDHVIESALIGVSSRDRPVAEWRRPEYSAEESLSLVKNALTTANMMTKEEFNALVEKSGFMSS